ncbi:MAG: AAA family ATPase [Pyrinomonadaceae bacterium]|nr:AAA family ATPase [Pyrinomonadaceae bacterium]
MATVLKTKPKKPFSISPNPSLLYLTPSLKSTIHKVHYVIENRQGLTAILGDIGLGKSSLLRYLHGQYVGREDVVTALMPSPNFPSDFAFLKSLCGDFGLRPRRSMVDQEQELRGFLVSLYSEDKTAVVFIDEAQRLTGKMLELVRVLLNFETEDTKLIQIVLAGQLELRTKLLDPTKKAIRSRIFAPSLLAPLSLAETREMISFRCEQAQMPNPFPELSVEAIYAVTGGVPREVLKVCAVALDMAQLSGEERIPPEAIEVAAGEALLHE